MTPLELPKLVAIAPHHPSPTAHHAGSVLLHARLRELSRRYAVTCVVPDTAENRAAGSTPSTTDEVAVVVTAADTVSTRARSLRQFWPALRGDLDIFAPRLSSAVSQRGELRALLKDAADRKSVV